MNSSSFDLLLDWASDAVYDADASIPKFFRKANEIDEDKGYRDAFGMYYEEQASFQIQCLSEAIGSIPIEKWDAFLELEGGWPERNTTFQSRTIMRRLVAKFLKETLGFGVDVVPVSDQDKTRFWVNAMIENFIEEEIIAIDDESQAHDLASALRGAFHKTVQYYITQVSYRAYNKGDRCQN